MFEPQEDMIERVVAQLRRAVPVDPALDTRVMQQIARLPAHQGTGVVRAAWRWLTRPHQFAVSPLGGLAIAAFLVLLAVILPRRRGASGFEFAVVAPHAGTVALVGDFNDWDVTRTPMRRVVQAGAVWTAVVPLSPGRYRYAFLVDGAMWLPDPAAPPARDEEFGGPSSVVTIGGT
ncbi:MAG TPA: isoamylase early set domain-containing protein [Gemmatimonadales bacterium]|nr:isoamylase early set domain-containing protein [Gemmatimonadales bacterium]